MARRYLIAPPPICFEPAGELAMLALGDSGLPLPPPLQQASGSEPSPEHVAAIHGGIAAPNCRWPNHCCCCSAGNVASLINNCCSAGNLLPTPTWLLCWWLLRGGGMMECVLLGLRSRLLSLQVTRARRKVEVASALCDK